MEKAEWNFALRPADIDCSKDKIGYQTLFTSRHFRNGRRTFFEIALVSLFKSNYEPEP
jgi:hypothetical protein